jgi:hypothetical protein
MPEVRAIRARHYSARNISCSALRLIVGQPEAIKGLILMELLASGLPVRAKPLARRTLPRG